MAISSYDPTDHHPVTTAQPVPARPVYPTAEALRDARMQRGICSDADCSWPIDGWCVTCRAKLCERHLHDHHNQHSREYLAAQREDLDELAAHVRDDAGATKVQRGDWVSMQSDPLGRMVGVVKRVAADGSWADVDWGRWTKRMQTAQLRMMVTLALRNGWTVTDMTRAAELEREA